MRIFLAGASGVIGRHLLPLLVEQGHVVGAMTRSAGKAGLLRELGGEPIVCDVFDRDGLFPAVRSFAPDLVLDELTDLPDDAADLPAGALLNARMRVEGTRNLVDAASAVGPLRIVAQSVAWQMQPGPGLDAVRTLEQTVLAAGGVVLRYGQFYGAGTYYPGEPPTEPRVEIGSAAAQTVEHLGAASGTITIVDRA